MSCITASHPIERLYTNTEIDILKQKNNTDKLIMDMIQCTLIVCWLL